MPHREYAITGSRIFPAGIEHRVDITNPAILPNHLTVERVRAGAHTRSRNESLSYCMSVPGFMARPSHARFVGRLGSAGSGGFGLVLAFCEAAWDPWWSWNAPRMFSRRLRRVLRSGMWWCAWRGRMRCVAGTVWWTVITIWVSSSLRVEVCATCSRGAGGGWALRAGKRAPSAVRRGTVGWVSAAKNSLSGCTGSETTRGW